MAYGNKSINTTKGTTINELEAFFTIVDKIIHQKLEENPSAGIIIARGQPNECRMRYTEALDVLKGLDTYFGMKGTFSFGICKTCKKFETNGFATGHMGVCKGNGKEVTCYESCSSHSRSGGGYGL